MPEHPLCFTTDTFRFLRQLENNNNRAWFNENKQRYEDLIRSPSLKFIEEMGNELPSLSPRFRAIPKKVGGSLMRVYRDIRYSKDKTPYKINIGINFRHEAAKDVHAPGYFVHISNSQCFIGLGIWRPESQTLKQIRECLDHNPRAWLAAKNEKSFSDTYRLGGNSLITQPRGYDKDHPLIEDLRRKDFIAICDLEKSMIISDDLVERSIETFSKATSFMRYLCYAVEMPFD